MTKIAPIGTSTVLQPHRRVLELDGLRALAALNLILFHLTLVYANKYGFESPLGFTWPFGIYGTQLFFILSGYVNSMSLLRRRRPVDFVAARLIRIVPMFVVVVLANLLILRLAPVDRVVSWGELAANLTLMPKVFGYECVDPVMWTLQIEMLFYGLLVTLFATGFCTGESTRRNLIGWGVVLAASLTMCRGLDGLSGTSGDAGWVAAATSIRHLLILDHAPLFAIGYFIYMIRTAVGPRWVNVAGIVAAAGVFHAIDHGKHNPAATVLIVALVGAAAYGRVPPLRVRPLMYLSTISYALYLTHNNLGCVVIERMQRLNAPPWMAVGVAILFGWAMAEILTHRVEGPMTRRLRRWWEDRRSDPRSGADRSGRSGSTDPNASGPLPADSGLAGPPLSSPPATPVMPAVG